MGSVPTNRERGLGEGDHLAAIVPAGGGRAVTGRTDDRSAGRGATIDLGPMSASVSGASGLVGRAPLMKERSTGRWRGLLHGS